MFSSSGYFRGVTCPYYASGLCERPYCHFRHVKPTTPGAGIRQDSLSQRDIGPEVGAEDGAASESIPAGQSSQSSSLLNMVGQAIKQVQRDIERDKATLCSIKATPGPVGGGAVGPSGAVGPGSAVYKPTPIGAKSSSGTSSGAGGLYGTRTTVPEYDPVKSRAAQYKPTPIKLLEKQKVSTKSPGLYTMDAADHVNDNEYDPATNFSTKGKGVAVKRPAGSSADSSKVKRLKVVVEEEDDNTPHAAFSDDEEIDETPESDQLSMEYLEAQRKDDKQIQLQKESGVFTMDVDAILGVPGKGRETGKQTSANVTKEKCTQKKSSASKSQTTNSSRDRNSSSSSNKNASEEKSTANKSTSQSVKLVKNDKRETEKKGKSKPSEQLGIKVKTEKSQSSEEVCVKEKSRHVEHKIIKEEGSSEDRNIFSILIGDLPETSNDSSVPGSIKTSKNGGSNKENDKSYSTASKQTCDKVSAKQSSSDSSVERSSSSHHRTHSSRDEKDHSDKKDRSIKSPSHHKSDSSHKHAHSSSSKRHRTSSGSSSSSSKQSHKTGSSSSGHRSSSHDRHQSTSKSPHSSSKGSSHSSTKSTSHSSTKDRDHKSSRSHHHEKSSSKPSHAQVGAKGAQVKPRTERLISHVDLFGEDSDGSDDVMIVEPPKVHIPVVELSSEESDVEDCSMATEVPEPQTGYTDIPDVGMMSDNDDEENDSLPEEDMPGLDESLLTEDTYDECLRIFNEESSRSAKPQQQPRAKVPEPEDEEAADQFLGKKRVARVTEKEAAITRKAPPTKSNVRPSASQVMHNRFLAIQKAAQEAVNRGDESQSGKGRVAHRPAASLIKSDQTSERKHTPITSVAKGIGSLPANRKAHTPSKATPKRPTIPADYGSKVPTAVRQRYLNMFIDEALKIYRNEKDAFDRALEEEKVVYGRSSSKNVYLNVAVNCIKKLRAESSTGRGDKNVTPTKAGHRQFSHEALLGGKLAAKTSFTVKRSGSIKVKVPDTFSPVQLYNLLNKYILTPEQLVDNGFPIMSEDKPGTAIIKENDQRKLRKSNKADERFCVRCGKWFLLTPDGDYVYEEECIYHWGKSWKRKIGNSLENRYTCCQEDASSTGCSVNKGHVHEQNKYENFIGYMQTMPRSPPLDGNYGVFALDCEMVYTTAGIELARITVINAKLESVYEQVVLPEKPIIDPNTRFSGLKEEDFVGVTTSIRDIQAVLLSMFSADTILIGHSLESDLTALKLVHKTVVDTSVVFPHRLGPPYKRALRTLMSEILQKIIQEGVGGHDSQEDANSAMELMIWKLKDDIKNAPRK